jgi:hypothetical protein
MDKNLQIFLPDTTLKLGVLNEKLSSVYGLEVINKKQKYLCIGAIVLLGGIVLYKYLKNK